LRENRLSCQFLARATIDHPNENLGAVNFQLPPGDIREIDSAFSKIEVHGGRMNEEQRKVVDQTA
jgi:hypothetical protein